ncbi:MAG: hypothetical protein NTW58_09035 [Actinobacteria bacterium]|nr:hypothetical protein [Actinomycetota bacterium]
MTPSSRSSWASTVASLRKASDGRLAGGREAPAHFERYVNLLFRLTVAHKDSAIRLSRLAASSTVWALTGGHDLGGRPAIRLTDGRYLRLVALLELDVGPGRQLRFQALTWQYQNAIDDDSWVFRADYSRARSAAASPPRGHLHVCGTLRQPGVLRPKQPLGRVHFPCHRPTLEAAVVLLADEFGVPTNAPHEVWRAAVAEHEARSARLFDS